MSLSTSAHVNQALVEIPSTVAGAVDEFEVGARLEMSGYGDRFAQGLGYPSVFEHAHVVSGFAEIPAERRRVRSDFGEAVKRSLFVLAGIVLCLTVVTGGPPAVALTGAAAWVGSIVVGSVLWWGHGRGDRALGSRAALASGAVVVTAGLVGALVTGDPAVAAGALWGCTAGITMIGTITMARVVVVLLGALVGHLLPGAQFDQLPGLTILVLLFALAIAEEIPRARGPRSGPTSGVGLTAALATTQVLAQITALAALLDDAREGAVLVLAATFTVTAIAEPLLEFAKVSMRFATARLTDIAGARLATGAVGLGWSGSLVLAGITAAAVVSPFVDIPLDPQLTAITLAVCGVISGVLVLLGTGSQLGAVVLSLAAAAASWFVDLVALTALPWFAALVVAAALAIGARRLANPGVW